MAIFKDSETPRMVAVSILHHHRDASFRLDLVGVLLDELDADMAALGFPNARKVLALGRAAVADATTVARALDVAIARREAAAEIRSAAKVAPEVSLAQARAEYTAPEDPADDRFVASTSFKAVIDRQVAAAREEGRQEGRAIGLRDAADLVSLLGEACEGNGRDEAGQALGDAADELDGMARAALAAPQGPRSQQALGALEDAAAELDAEESP